MPWRAGEKLNEKVSVLARGGGAVLAVRAHERLATSDLGPRVVEQIGDRLLVLPLQLIHPQPDVQRLGFLLVADGEAERLAPYALGRLILRDLAGRHFVEPLFSRGHDVRLRRRKNSCAS